MRKNFIPCLLLGVTALALSPARSEPRAAAVDRPPATSSGPVYETPVARPALDLSGRKRIGKASFYAQSFAGRKMADGKPMNPHDDNAASKTLPLGTVARVTHLGTGRSAIVRIQDRGPYVEGRIVDLSPATAERIGLTREDGVALVEVTPITLPLPGGGLKAGDAAGLPSG